MVRALTSTRTLLTQNLRREKIVFIARLDSAARSSSYKVGGSGEEVPWLLWTSVVPLSWNAVLFFLPADDGPSQLFSPRASHERAACKGGLLVALFSSCYSLLYCEDLYRNCLALLLLLS